MLRLNRINFSTKVQEILERYYLQPINGSKKINLKDGNIERSIHGAIHASRATLWALIMQNLLQELTPTYSDSSLKKIAQFINADADSVKLLILITMTCHDAARKGEDQDIWESESGVIAVEILKELGLDEKQAKLFAMAITFKDKHDEYLDELSILGINEQDYNAFDYIRKIVNLGDNLDLVRCVNPFKAQYIFDTLETVDGYDAAQHDDIILNLIKAIHQFVHEQRDMRYRCDIIDRNKKTIATHRNHVSYKEKVQLEHAENVFSVMLEKASNNPTLRPHLSNNLEVPTSKRYTGPFKFDPLIHGTNISIFATFPRSDFQVMSPLVMLDNYQAVSMTGELTRGGYDAVGNATVKEEDIGRTSFAKMTATDSNSYSLEKVLEKYTTIKAASNDTSLDDFKNALSTGLKQAFSNINLLLIYFARARQTHESLDQVISDSELKELQINLDATAQFYYFIQLLGIHIHPDFKAIERSNMAEDISNAAQTLLTFEHIVGKIKEHHIDMEEILKNPTPNNLRKALLVLELPKKCVIKSGASLKDKEVEFQETQFFCLQADYHDVVRSYFKADYTFNYMSRNSGNNRINDILKNILLKNLMPAFFAQMAERARKHLVALGDRVRLFHKLAQTPQNSFQLTEIQTYFLRQTSPIILVSENEDKITLYDDNRQEYRSITSLKLGSDIKIIATDTDDHRLEIMKFLELYNIEGVQVVLFSDLEASKASKEKPSEPYHHDDGVPTLKWLCAQQIHNNHLLFKPAKPASNNTNSVYFENNIAGATKLVDDAKKYSAITFLGNTNGVASPQPSKQGQVLNEPHN